MDQLTLVHFINLSNRWGGGSENVINFNVDGRFSIRKQRKWNYFKNKLSPVTAVLSAVVLQTMSGDCRGSCCMSRYVLAVASWDNIRTKNWGVNLSMWTLLPTNGSPSQHTGETRLWVSLVSVCNNDKWPKHDQRIVWPTFMKRLI